MYLFPNHHNSYLKDKHIAQIVSSNFFPSSPLFPGVIGFLLNTDPCLDAATDGLALIGLSPPVSKLQSPLLGGPNPFVTAVYVDGDSVTSSGLAAIVE